MQGVDRWGLGPPAVVYTHVQEVVSMGTQVQEAGYAESEGNIGDCSEAMTENMEDILGRMYTGRDTWSTNGPEVPAS